MKGCKMKNIDPEIVEVPIELPDNYKIYYTIESHFYVNFNPTYWV